MIIQNFGIRLQTLISYNHPWAEKRKLKTMTWQGKHPINDEFFFPPLLDRGRGHQFHIKGSNKWMNNFRNIHYESLYTKSNKEFHFNSTNSKLQQIKFWYHAIKSWITNSLQYETTS